MIAYFCGQIILKQDYKNCLNASLEKQTFKENLEMRITDFKFPVTLKYICSVCNREQMEIN